MNKKDNIRRINFGSYNNDNKEGSINPHREIDGNGGIEKRLDKLEFGLDQNNRKLAELAVNTASLTKDISEIKGRLSQIPTTLQLIGIVFGIMGGAFAIMSFTFTLMKLI